MSHCSMSSMCFAKIQEISKNYQNLNAGRVASGEKFRLDVTLLFYHETSFFFFFKQLFPEHSAMCFIY